MANRYIGPGKSLPWLNDTGRDAASGDIVPFGGGRAAIAEHDIAAGAMGQVTMSNVWLIDAPDGLAIAKGDAVYAADGKLAAEGDVLGIAVSPVLRGKVRVKLCPCAGVGSGGSDVLLEAGEGVKITKSLNAEGKQVITIALDLSLVSASDNLTIKKENEP